MKTVKYGLLVDYEYCSECHSCEEACRMEHGFALGECGIKVIRMGPLQIDEHTWEYDSIAVPTDLCDLCPDRTGVGKRPACVKHCQSAVLSYNRLDKLVEEMGAKPKMALFTPKVALQDR